MELWIADKLSPALNNFDKPIPIVRAQIELKVVIDNSFKPNFPLISELKIEDKITKNKRGVAAALISVIIIFPNSPKIKTLVPKIKPVIAPTMSEIIIWPDSDFKKFNLITS